MADNGLQDPGHTLEISVPSAQVRNLRSALAEQADLIGVGQELAATIEAQMQGLGEGRAAGLLSPV